MVKLKHQETHSKRLFEARLEGRVGLCVGLGLSDLNMMELGIGFTQDTAAVSSPLLVYFDLVALLYILQA